MARKIKVMISSRCTDLVAIKKHKISFTDLRKYVLTELENELILGKPFFDTVISEYITEPADDTSWDICLKEIVDSDLVLLWFTGHEGYKDPGKSIGICYAEYTTAFQNNPSKVFILDFRTLNLKFANDDDIPDSVKYDSEFAKIVLQRDHWLQRTELSNCESIDALKQEVKSKCYDIIQAAISQFVIYGSTFMRKSNYSFGEGLRWSKFNYRVRQEAIRHYVKQSINAFLEESDFSPLKKSIIVHALPDAMSIAEARELVGRPFLLDVELLSDTEKGPVHFVGVYKNATEKQLRDVIGHQDVAIIQESFGFYVWDLVNHIQMIYITNCKDPQITIIQTQAFFTWMRVQGETNYIISRAERRRKILEVIEAQKVDSDLHLT